jgi:hypothetical protein
LVLAGLVSVVGALVLAAAAGAVTPTITGSATASATVGDQISGEATLSGGDNPTGEMVFVAYGPDDAACAGPAPYSSDPLSITGNATYGNFPAFTPSTAGTYRWRAFYGGDDNNDSVSTACDEANSVVSAPFVPPPVIPSAPTPTGQRAAALKKCKKIKRAAARKKCNRKAKRLPV